MGTLASGVVGPGDQITLQSSGRSQLTAGRSLRWASEGGEWQNYQPGTPLEFGPEQIVVENPHSEPVAIEVVELPAQKAAPGKAVPPPTADEITAFDEVSAQNSAAMEALQRAKKVEPKDE